MRSWWLLAALLCPSLAGAASAVVDLSKPAETLRREWSLSDPAVVRWQRLFGLKTEQVGREVHYLVRQDRRGLQFLTSRLLYRGEPWLDRHERDGKAVDLRWHEADRVVKTAILRELRYRANARLIPVYALLLQSETRPNILRSALVNFHRIDPQALQVVLMGLVDPAVAGGYAGAEVPIAREVALTFALERLPAMAAAADRGLAFALTQGEGFERREAAARARRVGFHPACLGAVLARSLDQRRSEGGLSAADQAALVSLLALATRTDVAGQVVGLFQCALEADRALACAAIAALLRHPQELMGLSDRTRAADELRLRLAACRDVALRQGLLGLLAELDPAHLRQVAGPRSPWTAVSLHREALQAWVGEAASSTAVEPAARPEGGGEDAGP